MDAPRQCLELPAACSMPSLVAPAASSFQPAVPGPVGLGKAAAGQKRRGRKAQLAPPQSKVCTVSLPSAAQRQAQVTRHEAWALRRGTEIC